MSTLYLHDDFSGDLMMNLLEVALVCAERDLGPISEEQCRQVFRRLERSHDAEKGVNWDVLAVHAKEVMLEADSPVEETPSRAM